MVESGLVSIVIKIVFLLGVSLAIIVLILWTTGNMKILSDIGQALGKSFLRTP